MTEDHADPSGVQSREDLSRELTLLRTRSGLTVRDLARHVEAPVATVGDYFSGRHLPGPRQVPLFRAMLAACGVTDPAGMESWVAALMRARAASDRRAAKAASPYRGLEPFREDDAGLFFGRRAATDEVLAHLGQLRDGDGAGMVVLVGPSGSGKSSVLMAGLIPAVRAGALDAGGASWSTSLIAVEDLRRNAPPPSGSRAVVVVDQFEEALTLPADERAAVMDRLAGLASAGLVVVALRADFYQAAAAEPVLLAGLRDHQVLLGPMTREDLREVVLEPARQVGAMVEEGLVDLILADLSPAGGSDFAHEPGVLPLLSYALLVTWERAGSNQLSIADYREVGGLYGAVLQAAESRYRSLVPAEQDMARRLFARLVRVDREGPPTRRRASRRELLETGDAERDRQAEAVLERFIAARLVTTDADTVQVSHEALLSAWPRLAEWVGADREWLHLRQQLADSARTWDRGGRDESLLWRGARLESAAEQAEIPGRELNRVEAEFLAGSIAQRDQDRRAERTRTRRSLQLLAVVAVLAIVTSVLAAVAVSSRADAVTARNEALSRQVAIESQQLQSTEPALAAQLAVAAYHISPTVQARSTLLDTTALETPFRLLGPSGPTFTAVSGNGRLLATAQSGDDTVALYRLSAGKAIPAARFAAGKATDQDFAVGLSPDGRLLAAGGTGRTVTIWNVTDPAHPAKLQTLSGFASTVYSLAFAPDGRHLAAAGDDGTVREWPLGPAGASGSPAVLAVPAKPSLKAVAYSPDSTILAAAGAGGTVAVWGPARGQPALATGAGSSTYESVTVSPGGRLLAAGSSDDTVHLWNLTGPARLQPAHAPLAGSTAHIVSTAFSPDGSTLAAGDSDGTLRLYSTATWAPAASLQHPDPVTGVAFTPDGRTVVTSDSAGVTQLWPLPVPASRVEAGNVFTVAYGPGGRRVYAVTSGSAGGVTVWDGTDGLHPTRIGELPLPAGFGAVAGAGALSPDGRTLAVADDAGKIQLLDTTDPVHARPLGPPLTGAKPYVEQLGYGPDGKLLAAGDDSGQLLLWDVADPAHPKLAATRHDTAGEVLGFSISPDGRLLADAASDNEVRLYDISAPSRPRLLATLGGFTNYAYDTAFTPDSRTLIAGSADGTIRMWDVSRPADPRPLGKALSGPTGYVFQLAVSPDGHTLAAATTAHAVWMWDITSPARPRLLATLSAARNAVFAVRFSPGGRVLAASGSDNTLHFWADQPDRAARLVCAAAGQAITRAEWAHYIQGVSYRPPCP